MEFKNYSAIDGQGNAAEITIASGPVIIENGKVLLDKHGDDSFWKFPGGRQRDDESMQETARREVKEELGLDIEITSEPIVVQLVMEGKQVLLIHYPAIRSGEIQPGRDVREYDWFDINNLPDDCAPNVSLVIDSLR